MRKIYLKATVDVIVRADDDVTMEDLREYIAIKVKNTDPTDRFDIEAWDCSGLEVEDSK